MTSRVATEGDVIDIRLEVVGTEHPGVRADIPLDQLTDELRNDPSYLWVEDWPTPGSDLQTWSSADMYGYAYFDDIQVPFWFGPKASGYCFGFANPNAPKTEDERLAVVAKSTDRRWAIVDLPPYMRRFLDQPVMFNGVEIGTSQENQTTQYGHWFMRMFNVFMSAEAGDPIMVRYGGRTEAERSYHQRLGNGYDDKQALAEHKYVQAFRAWARDGRPEGQEPQFPDQNQG